MYGMGIFGNVPDPRRKKEDDPDLIRIRQEKRILDIQRELATKTFGFMDLISGSDLQQQKQSLADRVAAEEAKTPKGKDNNKVA